MSATRLLAMARKEWTQLRRDPRSMVLAFLLPLLLLVFFGYAITWDVEDVRLAVLDRDRTATSRELVEALTAAGQFRVVRVLDAERQVEEVLVSGDATAVLVIPPDFRTDVLGGRGGGLQLLVDGSDANTATIALNYADATVGRWGRDAARRRASGGLAGGGSGAVGRGGSGAAPAAPPLRLETRIWYNPTLESRNMIVPALVAVVMSIIAAMLTALTIAREWERGTMEQLASTPVTRLEVVLGKLLPYVLIGLVDVAVTVSAGMALFGTPLNGSVLLLAALTLLFLVGALGLGIFISAAVKSQVLATQIAMVATYLPAVLLSGFLFDIASMPGVLRAVTYLVPARYYVTVTRGIFLKGVGMEALWPQALLMLAFAVLGLGLATRVFRKEIAA